MTSNPEARCPNCRSSDRADPRDVEGYLCRDIWHRPRDERTATERVYGLVYGPQV